MPHHATAEQLSAHRAREAAWGELSSAFGTATGLGGAVGSPVYGALGVSQELILRPDNRPRMLPLKLHHSVRGATQRSAMTRGTVAADRKHGAVPGIAHNMSAPGSQQWSTTRAEKKRADLLNLMVDRIAASKAQPIMIPEGVSASTAAFSQCRQHGSPILRRRQCRSSFWKG